MSLVEAARFWNSFEAGLAESKLEDEGIGSVLFDGEMANFLGAGLVPIRLMVLDEDLEDARKILLNI
jgi:hypothetical protein